MTTSTSRKRLGIAVGTAFLSAASVFSLAAPASAADSTPGFIAAPASIEVTERTQNTVTFTFSQPGDDRKDLIDHYEIRVVGPQVPDVGNPGAADPDDVALDMDYQTGAATNGHEGKRLDATPKFELKLKGLPANYAWSYVTIKPVEVGGPELGQFVAIAPPPASQFIYTLPLPQVNTTLECSSPFNTFDALIKQQYKDFLKRSPRLDELVFWRQKLQNSPKLPVWNTTSSFRILDQNGNPTPYFLGGVRTKQGPIGATNLAEGYGVFRANNTPANVLTNPYVPATAAGAADYANAYPPLAKPNDGSGATFANIAFIDEFGQVRLMGTGVATGYTARKVATSCRVRADLTVYLYEEARQTYGPAVRLYNAVFPQRLGDLKGIEFWRNKLLSNSWSLVKIADWFTTSSEFKRVYEEETSPGVFRPLDNAEFVALVYTNVLHRPADGAGVAFWTRQLDTNSRTRGGIMVGFTESQEFRRITSIPVQTTTLVNSMTRSYKDPFAQRAPNSNDLGRAQDVAQYGLDGENTVLGPTRVLLWLDAKSFLPVEEPTPVLGQGSASQYPATYMSFAWTFASLNLSPAYAASIDKG